MFLRTSEPPPRMRFKAPLLVRPAQPEPMAAVRQEFLKWQDQIAERIKQADGLDLLRARARSPLRVWKWSLGTFFAVTLAHERRHIWQARKMCNERDFPTSVTSNF